MTATSLIWSHTQEKSSGLLVISNRLSHQGASVPGGSVEAALPGPLSSLLCQPAAPFLGLGHGLSEVLLMHVASASSLSPLCLSPWQGLSVPSALVLRAFSVIPVARMLLSRFGADLKKWKRG